jgi:TniQ
MTGALLSPRPLTRSLDPLHGESLAGYLLRLSFRLRVSPLQLARLAGCAGPGAGAGVITRRRMLDLDVPRFAHATRLSADEASSLTIGSWAGRYPPVARSTIGQGPPVITDNWLFAVTPRFCPECLAGDGSPVQQQYGGPWKKTWQLPVSFACPLHQRFLREACTAPHPARPGTGMLIAFPAAAALHPAQCRTPRQPESKAPLRPACGNRLDQGDGLPAPSPAVLRAQQRILALLDPEHPAEDASRTFTDLRVVSALLSMSWPLGRDLVDPLPAALVDDHVALRISGVHPKALDKQPASVLAAAGLLSASVTILDSPDLAGTIARHVEARKPGRPSRSAWSALVERHYSASSPAMRDAAGPTTRAWRRTAGPHSPKAPSRACAYRPEHIPALLEQQWYDEHLAGLGYKATHKGTTTMRRAGSVLLVQWAHGRSLGDAARYLGIHARQPQHSFGPDLARWLRDHGSQDFTAALRGLASQLDGTACLINYRHRRQAMQAWCLDPETWHEITSRLPPVPGPVQPILDDRKRQEASAFTWAYVTQGEPRFAPRPIEASQPEHVRKDWDSRRANLWHKLARPGRIVHYAELRKLLIEQGDRLARDIDYDAPPVLRQAHW